MVKKILLLLFVLMLAVVPLAACGGGGDAPADAPPADTPADAGDGGATLDPADLPETIRIGVPNPNTGPLAAFGVGTPFVENMAVDAVNANGGIYLADYDTSVPLEIIVLDTESDETKGSEAAQKLVMDYNVNFLVGRHTPATVLPVVSIAERYGVPCVSMECPVEPWQESGPYEWVYHCFWTVDTCYQVYKNSWDDLGFGEGTVLGFMYPNDADALMWEAIIREKATADGYEICDPGRYPLMNNDWTTIISAFKEAKVNIIVGNDIAPDFVSFITQAVQQGFEYDMITMGRAFLFPDNANSLPLEIANGLTCECWWCPSYPYASSLDGMTCEELGAIFQEEFGFWASNVGGKYACIELAVDAITRAGNLNPEDIRAALDDTDLDTMFGHINYDNDTHVSEAPAITGQWQLNEAGDAVELQIINTDVFPSIPTTADPILP